MDNLMVKRVAAEVRSSEGRIGTIVVNEDINVFVGRFAGVCR